VGEMRVSEMRRPAATTGAKKKKKVKKKKKKKNALGRVNKDQSSKVSERFPVLQR